MDFFIYRRERGNVQNQLIANREHKAAKQQEFIGVITVGITPAIGFSFTTSLRTTQRSNSGFDVYVTRPLKFDIYRPKLTIADFKTK